MTGASATGGVVANRGAITACVILAVIMQALDTTIANVALPYIQGSVSASADQINWVLTSYIVAAAVMTPPSGYLANRFGRKRILLISITGFVVASVLCGFAQSLPQIVGFRLLQGLFGAALVPLAQSILLDIYSVEERGSAMALFGVSVMVGPVLGPVIGGWLTENVSWRWVFYINVPIGALAFAGVSMFVQESKTDLKARLDWLGFGMLSITIAALQMFLDRGEQLNWFSSSEIIVEALICASAFYIFLVHTFTAKNTFVNPRLFLDRNFAVGMIFIFIIGITYLASLALMTPYLQTLMGYPVVTAGIVMGPRGLGTMACMFLVGRLIGKVDTRWLLLTGLLVTAWAMYDMTGWTPDVSQWTIISTGFIQGAGLGFLFVPLTTITFATLAPERRAEGTGLYNLSRNIGSSVGISVVTALLTENVQINHANIATYVTPYNQAFSNPAIFQAMDPYSAAGRAALDGVVTLQATIISYMNDFKLMMILSLPPFRWFCCCASRPLRPRSTTAPSWSEVAAVRLPGQAAACMTFACERTGAPWRPYRTPVCRHGLPNTGAFAPEAVLARASCRHRETRWSATTRPPQGLPERMPQDGNAQLRGVGAPKFRRRAEMGGMDVPPTKKPRARRGFEGWRKRCAFYSAGDGFFRNSATRLSHSSILAPWRFMMMPCCRIDSVLFQAQ